MAPYVAAGTSGWGTMRPMPQNPAVPASYTAAPSISLGLGGAGALAPAPGGRSLGRQEKHALWAVLAAGIITVVPMLRLLPNLLRDRDDDAA